MKLLRNNRVLFDMDEEQILNEFVRSDIFAEPRTSCDEKTKLALFISYNEPRGLQSTPLRGKDFDKLFDVYTLVKGTLL